MIRHLGVILVAIGMTVHAATMREVSYYCPRQVTHAPVIDGVLDDACWQQAATYTATYEYFKPKPGPGELKNTLRMVYDDFGLYLSIENYEARTDKLRTMVAARDSASLWTDDCAEIYLDNQPNGPGFRKFIVNAKGVLTDLLQVDGSVTRGDWNATGWRCQTKILPDRWIIECFFPWEDLGKKAEPGQVWRFCHTRFAWTTGKFVGTTSSPGGNYMAIDNFGYLCFLAPGKTLNKSDLGQLFSRLVTPPWGVVVGDELMADWGQGVKVTPLRTLVDGELRRVSGWLERLGRDPGADTAPYVKLKQRMASLVASSERGFSAYQQLLELERDVQRHYWRRQLAKEFL